MTLGLGAKLKASTLEAERDEPGELTPHVLAHHAYELILKALRNVPDEERAERQRELTNQLLTMLSEKVPSAGVETDDHVSAPLEMLLAVRDPAETRLGTGEIERPKIGLRQSDLLINGPRDLSVGHQIRSELASAGSTATLVQQSRARLCGVVIGTYDYSNSAGGKGHAVSLVGMFDLAENREN